MFKTLEEAKKSYTSFVARYYAGAESSVTPRYEKDRGRYEVAIISVRSGVILGYV